MRKVKSKLGVSIMIGYVLLVSIAMIIGAVTYAWMKTYVPADKLQCVDGVSMYLKRVNCTKIGTDKVSLELTLKNSGRFGITAYYGYVSNSVDKKPTIDISNYISSGGGSAEGIQTIYFSTGLGENNFKPDDEVVHTFEIDEADLVRIEILPGRIEEIKGKKKYAVCTDAKVGEEIICN
jgi:hypothetical protein